MKITIDGKEVEALEGQTVLEVAKSAGIEIPTLCHHGSVADKGKCRICVVEIATKGEEGSSKVITSCVYKAKEGIIVSTNSERAEEKRKANLKLLMEKAPGAESLKKLAAKYGLEDSGKSEGANKCIMCTLCTRLCAKQDVCAITVSKDGPATDLDSFLDKDPKKCIGCLICAKQCPTSAIPYEETESKRKIWGREFEMVKCRECGAFTSLTKEQAVYYVERSRLTEDYFNICEKCSRSQTANTFLKVIYESTSCSCR